MKEAEKLSLEQIRAFLDASAEVRFEAESQAEVYAWLERTLRIQEYRRLPRAGKGLMKRYLAKMTGLSRAQLTRLIGRFEADGEVRVKRGRRPCFNRRYTAGDIELLAEVDEAHDTISGPATQKILYRAYHEFADARFERLSSISVAHIYNLRLGSAYRKRRQNFNKTRPVQTPIGERRRPQPAGRAGYLRVDTVHQGDLAGVKGVYHINAVDEETQWQVVGAVAQISEAWLLPVMESMLAQFPFRIRGFHSDNGSEFINHKSGRAVEQAAGGADQIEAAALE